MKTLVHGGTIIDAVGDTPLPDHSVLMEGDRIVEIAPAQAFAGIAEVKLVDAQGKFVIPGLMNANVHLLCDVRIEVLARYFGRFDELITEAAQVALRGGVTTVFDTWGPRRFLMEVRDRIAANEVVGSRIFCAGNIVGFDGPFSHDFLSNQMGSVSPIMQDRLNAIWVENVGRHLMWQSPAQVAEEIRHYIGKGIDFIKYASNEHFGNSAGALLAFSPDVQRTIVDEAHRAGLTAQAHTMSVEGLRLAVEAGCDLIQHANITGPVPIPDETLRLIADRRTGAVLLPWTRKGLDWLNENLPKAGKASWHASDTNVRNLLSAGATLLMSNDGALLAQEAFSDPLYAGGWGTAPEDAALLPLSTGHFVWFRALEEKGCPPIEMLRAATINVARAYRKDADLGSLERGKIADLLVLTENPLLSADNYQRIETVIKGGRIVDCSALPEKPIFTAPLEEVSAEERNYRRFLDTPASFPICSCLAQH